jgi:hypothetical protein
MSSLGTLAWHRGDDRTKGQLVEISQLVSSAVSALVGVVLAGLIVGWRQSRAERNWHAGRPVAVPGSIRRPASGRLAGLWRHGTIDIHGGKVVWTPRTPWGRSVELGGVGFGSQRPPAGLGRLQLPPAAVVVSCADHGIELAVLPRTIKYIYGAHFAV